jgi:hypothetical protein
VAKMAKAGFSTYLEELCLLPKDVPRVKVFTGKNGSFLEENDILSMSGKAWKKNMGKFSLSYMVRRIFSSEKH